MPGTFAALDQNLPRFTGGEDLEERVRLLQDYQYQLLEQLRYILSHLDMRCFNQTALKEWTGTVTAPIYGKIEDAEGNITQLELTAKGLQLQVSDNKGNISSLQQTATSLSSQIRNAQGDISTLQQTATSLSSQISSAQGDISTLKQTAVSLSSEISSTRDGLNSRIEQTASSLTTQINNTEAGLSSRIEQTAASLSSTISSQAGQISSLQQTASSILTTVGEQGRGLSSLQQTVDGFHLTVSNGDASSTLTLMSGWTEISSAEIVLRGEVTLEDLAGAGRTSINGANINTGTIAASYVGVDGCFALYNGGRLYGYMGCGYGSDGERTTYGAWLGCADGGNYLLASDAGVRMQDRMGGAIYVSGGDCASTSEMMVVSDRRAKEDIRYDLERYRAFFRALRPCRFRMKGKSGGFHTGFIAQEVEDALKTAGLGPEDFTGLVKLRREDGDDRYYLRYGAFPALNTYILQDLEKRVSALEGKM